MTMRRRLKALERQTRPVKTDGRTWRQVLRENPDAWRRLLRSKKVGAQ